MWIAQVSPAAGAPRRRLLPDVQTVYVFAGALLFFAISVTEFEARVTDISALRVLVGQVPYRDFWTMYAPGSFTTLALGFAVFGPQLLVSNVLGILTSAAAMAMYYRFARITCGSAAALVSTALVTVAFFGTDYHNGFTSYPPAFLLILAAAYRVALRSVEPGRRWAIGPGLVLGIAALFKHDIAGYAALAIALALGLVRRRTQTLPIWTPSLGLCVVAAAVVAVGVAALAALGAGPDLWRDLVLFPLTDFRYVRPEYFPILPRPQGVSLATAQDLVFWGIANFPFIAFVTGMVALWRGPRLEPRVWFIVVFGSIAFWFHWAAAHVQMNTNAISLAEWGALVGSTGLHRAKVSTFKRFHLAIAAAVLFWGGALVARPVYRAVTNPSTGSEPLDLPRLWGIRASHADARWMRQLAADLVDHDQRAPLLFLSNRNDVHIFAESSPFWLTTRRDATRHHELHPGITDTAPIQQEILTRLRDEPPPVVVREHRFSYKVLDIAKQDFLRHVPVGSMLIDEWLERHYDAGPRFGRYEVMRRRSNPTGN